jgi:hypothetical protein
VLETGHGEDGLHHLALQEADETFHPFDVFADCQEFYDFVHVEASRFADVANLFQQLNIRGQQRNEEAIKMSIFLSKVVLKVT